MASLAFSTYLGSFNSYNRIYGSIGAVVALLMWFYLGEFGGGDPDNRHLMRLGSQLSPHEKAQLDRMSRLMKARQSLRGLRRGKLVTAMLNRLATPMVASVPIPSELGWTAGATLTDQLTGSTLAVPGAGGRLSVTVPARGGVVLSQK